MGASGNSDATISDQGRGIFIFIYSEAGNGRELLLHVPAS